MYIKLLFLILIYINYYDCQMVVEDRKSFWFEYDDKVILINYKNNAGEYMKKDDYHDDEELKKMIELIKWCMDHCNQPYQNYYLGEDYYPCEDCNKI